MTHVHLAGNFVVIGSRVIQRCLVCGYKLIDNLGQVTEVTENDPNSQTSTWPIGGLIQIDDGNPVQMTLLSESENPIFEYEWNNCCVDLVEN